MKYVLVDDYNLRKCYPFISELDIDTLTDQLYSLNDIAISESSNVFSFNSIKLTTILSCYTEEYYFIYTLDDWFDTYKE